MKIASLSHIPWFRIQFNF